MQRYGGYTIDKIENELTWEQVFLMVDTIKKRQSNKKNNHNSGNGIKANSSNRIVKHHNIQDIAEGKAKVPGLNINYKEV